MRSLEDLKRFSFFLSKIISKNSFLALSGSIGSGKTTLVSFLCSFIGVKETVNSPTFNIVKSYWVERKNCYLNHFDFFRVSNKDDFSIFEDLKEESINIVEWAEISPSFWVNEEILFYLKISFVSSFEREISITIFK